MKVMQAKRAMAYEAKIERDREEKIVKKCAKKSREGE